MEHRSHRRADRGRPTAHREIDALFERVQKLRMILPVLAEEAAVARRDAARLRVENRKLRLRIGDLERLIAASRQLRPSRKPG